jgi:hypothetical protein
MAVTCLTTAGFELECKKGIGGIKALFLTDILTFNRPGNTNTIDPTTEQITALDENINWFRFDLPRSTGQLTQTVAVENNAIFYTQTVEATFPYLKHERRKQLEIIVRGRHVMIVQDNNDNYWLLGYKDGVEVTAQTSQTGTAKGDLNGSTITFVAEEPYSMYRLADALVANDFDGNITFPTI